jgi:hypothetical protein
MPSSIGRYQFEQLADERARVHLQLLGANPRDGPGHERTGNDAFKVFAANVENHGPMGFYNDTLSVTQTLATSFWTGSSAGFAFIAAPIVAHEANDLDLQAKITGKSLDKIVNVAYVAGGIAIACAALQATHPAERTNDSLRALFGAGALVALARFQNDIVPQMTQLQQAMGGSFKSIPEDDPNRIAYRALHKRSTQVFGTALLLGIGQLILNSVRSRNLNENTFENP